MTALTPAEIAEIERRIELCARIAGVEKRRAALKPGLMLRARWHALLHMRFVFPRKGCRIWRLYSHFGFKTRRVFCQCGKDFQ